jgi:mannose-1-phosphate guanylyltransferase
VVPALVLTAGLGTRLDPLTRLVAKPAVPLAGETLVERILRWLVRNGVSDVVLNLHHRPETITAIVGDGHHLGLRVRYSWEAVLLGSAGGPRHALPLLDADPILIVNGDTLTEIALAPMVARHEATGADVTLAVIRNPWPDRYNGIVLDDQDRVVGVVPRGPQAVGTWHFVGVQVAKRSVFSTLPDGVPAETLTGVYREAIAAGVGAVRGWRASAAFIDVGTPRDYLDAALTLAVGTPPGNVIEPGARVHPSARLTRSLVWGHASIGPNAALEGCIIADADVPAEFRARDAALLPARAAEPDDLGAIRDGVLVIPIDR